jgi:hypothetical protein
MIKQIQITITIIVCGLLFVNEAMAQGFKKNQIIFSVRSGGEYNLITKLSNNGVDIPMSAPNNFWIWNWFQRPRQNWYTGTGFTLYKPLSPLGASFDLLFVNRAYNIKTNLAGVETTVNHRLLGISPVLMFKLRTGGIEKMDHFFVNFGGSYNYYFNYKRTIDNNKVNNDIANINQTGLMGVFGLGYELTPGGMNQVETRNNGNASSYATPESFFNIYIKYHHNFSNVFNPNYLENGVKPYENWKTQLGYISIGMVIRGQMHFQRNYY